MDEYYLGCLLPFAGTYAIRNFDYCMGQIIPIQSNESLYSLLGNNFGGDGRNTFGYPDLRGRAPIGAGKGPGLDSILFASKGGCEYTTLEISQIPPHSHSVQLAVTGGEDPVTGSATPLYSVQPATSVTPSEGDVPAAAVVKPSLGTGENVASYASIHQDLMVEGAPIPVSLNGAIGGSVNGVTGATGAGESVYMRSPFQAINWLICTNGLYPSRS